MGKWRFTVIGFLTGAGISAVRLIAAVLFGDGPLTSASVMPAVVIPLVMLVFGIGLDLALAHRGRRK